MKSPSTMGVSQTLAEAAAGYQPRKRVAYQNLMPFKEVIHDLRKRGASFLTIAELLKKHAVKTCHEAVRQFFHASVGDGAPARKSSPKRKTRRNRQPRSRTTSSASGPVPVQPKQERGPRIARIEEL